MRIHHRKQRPQSLAFLTQVVGRSGVAALLACLGLLSALMLGTVAPSTTGGSIALAQECPTYGFQNVCVPGGDDAFAQNVVDLSPGNFVPNPAGACVNLPPNNQGGTGSAALGPPDDPTWDGSSVATTNSTSLGFNGGSITLGFTLPLTGSGNADPDLWVWEVGVAAEPYTVEVSADGSSWTMVGSSNQATNGAQGFDIDGAGFTQTDRLYFVRITDTNPITGPGGTCNEEAKVNGSDIDAVAVLSPVFPEIGLDKTADPSTDLEPGDEVTYSFEVENTGSDDLESIAIADPMEGLSAIDCPVTALAPSGTTTCTATYTVTQEDVDAGTPIDNTATVTGVGVLTGETVTDEDTATITFLQEATIEIDKSTTYAGPLAVGDIIPYTFEVTNTGTVTLTDVTVTDPLPGLGAITPASVASLAAGESATFTATYTVTQADVDRGAPLTNTATTTGTPPDTCATCETPTDDDTEEVPNDPNPAFTLEKTSDVEDGTVLAIGDVVTYTFVLTNTGNVTLHDASVVDELPGLSAITPASVETLAPGESATFTATYTVIQADIDAGEISNSATGIVVPPDECTECPPVEPPPPSIVIIPIPQEPAIAIDKSSDPVSGVREGDTVTYTFDVTNTGDVTLTDVTVTDPLPGLSAISPASVDSLAPGESAQFTATYTVTAADVDAGVIDNTATTTGTPPDSCDCAPPTATDEHEVTTGGTPALAITKVSDVPDGETRGVGDVITYTFTVENTGNVPIDDVTISDDMPGLTWVTGPNLGTLQPGESATGTATHVVTQAEVDAGEIRNSATTTGDCGEDCTVVPPPPVVVIVPPDDPAPAIDLEKSSDPAGGVVAGDVITYTITATNTGNVTLTDVTVTDPLPGLSAITPASVDSLAPGESATFTATYTVTATDVARGVVHNTATGTGTPPDSCDGCTPPTDEDDHDVPTSGEPGILLDKEADTTARATLGQTITYTFTVTNTGDVNLSNVAVTDPMVGLSSISCPQTTLLVGQSMECTATYVVTQADIDNGRIDNSATATGDPAGGGDPVEDGDDESVPTEAQIPGIQLDKVADNEGPVAVGDTITYTFTATNTGNVTLTDVTITDNKGGLVWITGPELGVLAPGETATGTATYVVTQADVDAGEVYNSATGTGTPPDTCIDCPPPTDPGEEIVTTEDPAPAVDLTKSADTEGPVALGQTITYTFTATNTGNVTLDNVTVGDELPGLVWVNGPNLGTLAPGESATGTATYTVTEADIQNGSVINTATITVEPPCDDCTPVLPPPPTVEIPTEDPNPAVAFTKEADTEGPVSVGDTITYTFTATNTGNVTLTDVTIDDQLPGLVWVTGPNLGTLAPGESATGTATYVVTQADVDSGRVVNTASITVIPECDDCTPVLPPPPTVEVPTDDPAPAIDLTKVADTAGPVNAGDVITYTFTATNTGNVTLDDVTISDLLLGLTWVTGPNLGTLAPGESATGTATYTVTEADVNAGSVTNTATITIVPRCDDCTPVLPPPPTVEIPTEDPVAALDLTKEADTAGPVFAGDTITYTFTATNTGNETLDDVTITDELPGLVWVTGPNLGTLAPGESATGTATYVVTEADVAAGSVLNSATVTVIPHCDDCTPVLPPPPTVEVPTGGNPGIVLEKSSDTDGPVSAGDVIIYTFTVTNTGAVALTNIGIDDPKIGTVFCANELAAGETVTCSAPYTVTADDVASGQVYNSATATGNTPDGGTVTDDDDDTVSTGDPCAPVETPLSGETLNLSLRALQVDPSTPEVEPTETATEEPTLEPTEPVTETATATETATETATVDPGTPEPTETAPATETATQEATIEAGTPAAGTPSAEAECHTPTPQPTPTPKPGNPGNPGGGGNVGGGIPPVTNLPSTGANAATTDDRLSTELFMAILGIFTLLLGSYALRRYATRDRADQ